MCLIGINSRDIIFLKYQEEFVYLSDFLKNRSTYIAQDNLGELHGTFNYLVQRDSGDVFEELPKRTPEEKWMIKITYGRRK